MKKTYIFVILIFTLFKNQTIFGQYLQLTYPIYQGVYQRDPSDNADIPVSGQVFGFPNGTPGTYKIECITNRLDQYGAVISGTSSTTLITYNTSKGYFSGSISRSKGWYSLLVKYTFNATGYNSQTSSKFGVGDVFIIAGQSNGQGVSVNSYPSTNIPEWIVGNNEEWNCRKEFESRPSMTKINGTNLIGPTGNNSWCYGVLGKSISDANGQNLPVAFLNTCATGSSVKNWSDGADGIPTLGYQNGNVQWCPNFPALSGNQIDYFYGQPYLTLKNTLNWYVPMFGVRAILWHQGEADADNNSTNTVLSRTGTLYRDYLNNVISKSRDHSDISNLSWMIAKVSYSSFNTAGGTFEVSPSGTSQPENYAKNVRDSQGDSPIGVITGNILAGPLTDWYNNSSTATYRNADGTHFDEMSNGGLTFLASLWQSSINYSTFIRTTAKPIPEISISQSVSTYTFSIAPVSNADYCWTSGNTLAPPDNSSSCLSTGTSVTSGSSVRCFIGTNNSTFTAKNWVSTGVAGPQNCPGCREGVEETYETYGGINMKVYPNPSDKDFRVEFDVSEDDTHVKLEFFDIAGRSVKVIADGSHAKGHFNYPITETLPTGLLICQLKVGDIYISQKLSRVH